MAEDITKVLVLYEPGESRSGELRSLETKLQKIKGIEVSKQEYYLNDNTLNSILERTSPDLVIPVLHTQSAYDAQELADKVLGALSSQLNNGNAMSVLFYECSAGMRVGFWKEVFQNRYNFPKERISMSSIGSDDLANEIDEIIDDKQEIYLKNSMQISNLLQSRHYENTILKHIGFSADKHYETINLTFFDDATLDFVYERKKEKFANMTWSRKYGQLHNKENVVTTPLKFNTETIKSFLEENLPSETFYTAFNEWDNHVRLVFCYSPTPGEDRGWDELDIKLNGNLSKIVYTNGKKIITFR